MVGLLLAPRISYGRTLRGPPLLVRLDSKRPPGFRRVGLLKALGFRMVGLSEAPRFSYGWTFGGFLVFVWLTS